jgi:hypothetical protein
MSRCSQCTCCHRRPCGCGSSGSSRNMEHMHSPLVAVMEALLYCDGSASSYVHIKHSLMGVWGVGSGGRCVHWQLTQCITLAGVTPPPLAPRCAHPPAVRSLDTVEHNRVAADGAERTHRRVHTARKELLGLLDNLCHECVACSTAVVEFGGITRALGLHWCVRRCSKSWCGSMPSLFT